MSNPDSLGRVAGLAVMPDGALGAVWLTYEPRADVAHVVDAAVLDVSLDRAAECLNARGRDVAVAWAKAAKPVADRLLNNGCNMLIDREAVDDDATGAAVQAREMVRRLTEGRLVADPRVREWTREYTAWERAGTSVPETPLLTATRYALERLSYARPRGVSGSSRPLRRKIAIV